MFSSISRTDIDTMLKQIEEQFRSDPNSAFDPQLLISCANLLLASNNHLKALVLLLKALCIQPAIRNDLDLVKTLMIALANIYFLGEALFISNCALKQNPDFAKDAEFVFTNQAITKNLVGKVFNHVNVLIGKNYNQQAWFECNRIVNLVPTLRTNETLVLLRLKLFHKIRFCAEDAKMVAIGKLKQFLARTKDDYTFNAATQVADAIDKLFFLDPSSTVDPSLLLKYAIALHCSKNSLKALIVLTKLQFLYSNQVNNLVFITTFVSALSLMGFDLVARDICDIALIRNLSLYNNPIFVLNRASVLLNLNQYKRVLVELGRALLLTKDLASNSEYVSLYKKIFEKIKKTEFPLQVSVVASIFRDIINGQPSLSSSEAPRSLTDSNTQSVPAILPLFSRSLAASSSNSLRPVAVRATEQFQNNSNGGIEVLSEENRKRSLSPVSIREEDPSESKEREDENSVLVENSFKKFKTRK